MPNSKFKGIVRCKTKRDYNAIQNRDPDKLYIVDQEERDPDNTVTGIKGETGSTFKHGNVTLTKSDFNLQNVDNTHDLDKPVSNQTATAINVAKADVISASDSKYANKLGNYPDLNAGNIISSVNKSWENSFIFGSTAGSADTQDGTANIKSVHGHTTWTNGIPVYTNISKLTSTGFNLYDKTANKAKVIKTTTSNNGLCIRGTGITTSTKVKFGTDGTTFGTTINVVERVSSVGITYLGFDVPNDGYVRLDSAPTDVCISNVWSGYRVEETADFKDSFVNLNTNTKFSTGLKSVQYNNKDVVYDEMLPNKYYTRVNAYTFTGSETLSLVGNAGNYVIYRMTLSSAYNLGYAYIGGLSKFTLSLTDLTTSSSITADSMCLNSGYIKFAITKEEDTLYNYVKDTTVVDAETFATSKATHGTLYVLVDNNYSEIDEYDDSVSDYYYREETSKAGSTILEAIATKIINYQIKSMDKTAYVGTAISPVLNWSYEMSDFGTEELTLVSGFNSTPTLEINYPMNIRDTVQRYQEHTISAESFDNLASKIKDVAGLQITKNWNADKNEYEFDVVDTKETIHIFEQDFSDGAANEWKPITKKNDSDFLSDVEAKRKQIPPKIMFKKTIWHEGFAFFVDSNYGHELAEAYYKPNVWKIFVPEVNGIIKTIVLQHFNTSELTGWCYRLL